MVIIGVVILGPGRVYLHTRFYIPPLYNLLGVSAYR